MWKLKYKIIHKNIGKNSVNIIQNILSTHILSSRVLVGCIDIKQNSKVPYI